MSDTEKSFTYLHDNIPQWLKNITEIEEKVAHMQSEMAKVPVSRSPLMKRKTGSVESIRDLDAILEDPSSSTAAQQSPFATRKRKTPSILSAHASGPTKYRSRMMIIVQYDGQIQKQFESLVRCIGTGRNMLRKGKMAAKMEALAELAGSSDESEGDDDNLVMSKIGYRHRGGLSSMRSRPGMRGLGARPGSNASPEAVYDSTDKALELAQGLCERAAHQSLRDGECRKEMDGVRRHFEEVLQTASKEVEKYKARKEKEAEQAAAKAQEEIVESPTPTFTPMDVEPKPTPPVIRATTATAPTTTKAVDIEIDDESEDDDFVMPPIRLTSRQ